MLNDGAVAYRDLSPRTSSVTYDFIRRAYELHEAINSEEEKVGLPGVRMVVAGGFRVRRRQPAKAGLLNGIAKRLTRRAEASEIPILEAINKAITIKPYYAAVPELAANFAFSKAYLAECGGSKKGFSGSNIFIDRGLLSSDSPAGLILGSPIHWQSPGLDTTFFPVTDIDPVAAGKSQHTGFCNAFEVAENIASSEGVIERLKEHRITQDG